jgi:RNA polymerase sigma factor (sigma-70 family)
VLELRRQTDDDQALIAAYRAGDDDAFGRIHERHHAALERYARKVLSRSSEHAEDVVQEAMLRASRALRRDDRHIELRPWLYRLTRNCALDELARVRTDSVNFDDAEDWGVLRAPAATEPEAVVESRGKVRDLLADLAGLPAQQRHALLRREVDGISHAALADELGVTPQATKNLVHRARTNLVKQRDARSSDCHAVRSDLLEAHDEGRRASAASYRHVATCRDCRHFRAGLKDTRKAAAILMPMPLMVVAFGLLTGKAAAATAKGAMVKSAATAAAGVAITAGAVGVGVQVFGPGEPAPQAAKSRALPSGSLAKGAIVPAGTAIVRKTVTLSPGSADAPTVTLPCPAGTRVADLIGARGASASYARGTVVGVSRSASVIVQPRPDSKVTSAVVTVLCKRPDASGSIVAGQPQGRAASGIALHVKVTRAELFERPGGAAVGSVRLGQPVRASGDPRNGWRKVTTDTGATGWLRAGVVG